MKKLLISLLAIMPLLATATDIKLNIINNSYKHIHIDAINPSRCLLGSNDVINNSRADSLIKLTISNNKECIHEKKLSLTYQIAEVSDMHKQLQLEINFHRTFNANGTTDYFIQAIPIWQGSKLAIDPKGSHICAKKNDKDYCSEDKDQTNSDYYLGPINSPDKIEITMAVVK